MRRFNCKTRWQLPEGIVLNFINRLANFKPLTRTKGLKDISPINMYASRLIWDNPASKWITWSYPTTLQVDHFKSHRFLKMSQLSAFAVNRCRTHLQCSDKLWASEVQKLREANLSASPSDNDTNFSVNGPCGELKCGIKMDGLKISQRRLAKRRD